MAAAPEPGWGGCRPREINWELKGLMDQHNFSAYGLAEPPARKLESCLDGFLASLGEVTSHHPLLETAWRAGVTHAASLHQGQDPHVL